MGDFNAQVCKDFEIWDGILGRHGVGNCNDNGRLLLEFCSGIGFTITNTLFQQENRYKKTWRHPWSKHWHLLDYILVRQKDTKDVLHNRVMTSAECYTNHRLVWAKVRLTLNQVLRKKAHNTKKLEVDNLKQREQEFQEKLSSKLSNALGEQDAEQKWEEIRKIL